MVPGDVIGEIVGGVSKNFCTFSKTIYNEIPKFNVEMSQMMILLETLRIHRSVNKSDILEILGESGWPGGVGCFCVKNTVHADTSYVQD